MKKEGSKEIREGKRNEHYLAGLDCATNGANTTNCSINHFSTVEKKDKWQAGYDAGKKLKNS